MCFRMGLKLAQMVQMSAEMPGIVGLLTHNQVVNVVNSVCDSFDKLKAL